MAGTILPTSQASSELERIYGSSSGTSIESVYHPDFWVEHAIRETFSSYGDIVDVKPKSLHKFGENLLVGTSRATIMSLPAGVLAETYATTNSISHISSSSAADAQIIRVEYHTVDGSGNFTFGSQLVTLNGQTKVALTTTCARVSRVENMGVTDNAGAIYVFEDDTLSSGVPTTSAKVHMIVEPGENQSLKAATTISNNDYEFITQIKASVNKKTTGGAVICLRVREKGGVFKTKFKRGVNSNGPSLNMDFRPFLIVPQNADIIMTAEADGASTPVSAGWNSILATIKRDV